MFRIIKGKKEKSCDEKPFHFLSGLKSEIKEKTYFCAVKCRKQA